MNKKQIVIISLVAVVAIALVSLGVIGWRTGWSFRNSSRVSQPEYWPTNGWQSSTPEQQGIYSDKVAEALLTIREKNIQVHSLLIIRNGYKVLDATFYPYDGKAVHDIASDTKSVMTTLIGIAADQGKVDLDDTMLSFFPNYTIANPEARKNDITVRHLASMSSGLDCTAEADEKTLKEMRTSPDYVQFVLDRQSIYAPGEQFIYCSPAIHLLSPILQRVTGQSALEFARLNLFEPLGIHDFMWEKDPQGYYDGWGDLSLFPEDMAKIGFLFLHKGQWDGKQVVSRQWVEDATTVKVDTPDGNGYGYGWWIDPAVESAYRADGRGGQYIIVLPEWNMVVVTTGGGFLMDDIAPYLIASFGNLEKPLAANPQGVARLEDAVAKIKQAPAKTPVSELPPLAMEISGNIYVIQPNPAQLEKVAIMFDGSDEATISMQIGERPLLSYKAGLDNVFRFSEGIDGRPIGYRGEWLDPQTFLLEYDGIANNDHSFIQIRFEGDQVQLSIQETAHELGAQYIGQLEKQ